MQSVRPESPMSQLWIYFKTTFSPLTGQLDYVSIHKLLCNTETNLQIYKMPHIQHDSDVIMSAMVSQITGVCLLNRLFRCRSKKTSKLRVTGLCEGNSPMTGEFPSQRISNAEMLLFDDVIMARIPLSSLTLDTRRLWDIYAHSNYEYRWRWVKISVTSLIQPIAIVLIFVGTWRPTFSGRLFANGWGRGGNLPASV